MTNTTSSTSNGVEARARELLAAEYDADDMPSEAQEMRNHGGSSAEEAAAVRTIARLIEREVERLAAELEWQPMETAPKDGTLVELVVDYEHGGGPLYDATLACTIGYNSCESTGEDLWQFAGWCWTHDHFVEGRGEVRAWRPSRLEVYDSALPPLPGAALPASTDCARRGKP